MTPFWLTLWVALASASVIPDGDSHIRVSRSISTSGFSQVGPAAPEEILNLRFALTQSDPDGLISALQSVSDPTGSKYGQHLSKAEVEAFVTPSTDSVQVVNDWFAANNLTYTPVSPSGDWVAFQVTVSKANELFNASFNLYSHAEAGMEAIRTPSYSVPASLRAHVDLIHPTISFPSTTLMSRGRKQKRSWVEPEPLQKRSPTVNASTSVCSQGTTPACLQELYQIPSTPARNKHNRIGVSGFPGNEAHFAYLEVFLEQFRPDMDPKTNFTVVGIDGGSDEQNPYAVIEGDLDIQYTVGLAIYVNVTEYFVGINTTDGVSGFLDEAKFLAALDTVPQVLKICQVYAQLGARGTTLLFGSGDGGPGCGYTNVTNFEAMFPASCPYVTAVGGTTDYYPETAWSGSGGGFSTYFARPAFQDSAVSAYLASSQGTSPTNAGRFNASGRGIPDIAAHATNFTVYADGSYFPTMGTSAATPTMASIIALINDRLLSAGRPPMGWLNPWLYHEGYKAFTDVATDGSRISCATSADSRGWNSSVGWDPVTGFGAPRFDALLSILHL